MQRNFECRRASLRWVACIDDWWATGGNARNWAARLGFGYEMKIKGLLGELASKGRRVFPVNNFHPVYTSIGHLPGMRVSNQFSG